MTIENHFAVSAVEGARRQNIPLERVLEGTGIAPDTLQTEGGSVDPSAFAKLIQRLWVLLEDEFMGLGPSRSKPGTFATMCQLVIHAPNLEVMLKRGARFYGLFEDALNIELSRDDSSAFITFNNTFNRFDANHFLEESLLVIWHRTACWMVDQLIPLKSARFSYPAPPHQSAYKAIFNTELHFDQAVTQLEFPAKFLELPVAQSERTLVEFLRESPADLLARPAKDESYAGRIRALIGYDIECDLPAFESVAEQLGLSPQTLRRRLKEEGTSYQELKDLIRRDIALHFLNKPQYSIHEIAQKVGFAEPSAFHRAFKKWVGLTPSDYRQTHLD
ncbi:AraC-type DNA-binding domain-containing protein [gamma proteobacterium HTCC5015]|nr:AraC-type DNA-binding domain-containing protein [gamma proteobacterium HTCC5015]